MIYRPRSLVNSKERKRILLNSLSNDSFLCFSGLIVCIRCVNKLACQAHYPHIMSSSVYTVWHGDRGKKLHSSHSLCLRASNKPNVISPLSKHTYARTHGSDKCITKAKCCSKHNHIWPIYLSL